MPERSPEWLKGYTTGYEDGGNSTAADFMIALSEADLPDAVTSMPPTELAAFTAKLYEFAQRMVEVLPSGEVKDEIASLLASAVSEGSTE